MPEGAAQPRRWPSMEYVTQERVDAHFVAEIRGLLKMSAVGLVLGSSRAHSVWGISGHNAPYRNSEWGETTGISGHLGPLSNFFFSVARDSSLGLRLLYSTICHGRSPTADMTSK